MAQEKRTGRKRLSVDIPTAIHNAIAQEAVFNNCTVTSYVLRALIAQLKRDEQFK